MRLIRLNIAVWFSACFIASPQFALAQGCVANAHVDRVTMEGNVRTTHCKCDDGFEPHGGACVSSAYSQADSERRSGASGCQYDGRGNCVKGSDLPKINPRGSQSTRAAVFPGLTNNKWDRLQSSAEGKALIKEADSLRDQQAQAKKAIDDIRLGPDAGQRQQELIAENEKLRSLNNSLNKMQGRAERIIDRVTLER